MNIILSYQRENSKQEDIVIAIKRIINNEKTDIKVLENCDLRKKVDILIIFSDDINHIKESIQNIKNKIKSILIVTNSLETNHILSCIEITPYICYLDIGSQKILERIVKLGENKNE